MSKVRCIHSSQLDVVSPGGLTSRVVFSFGDIYNAQQLEVLPDDYVNVVLANGNRIDGVHKSVFENLGAPIVVITQPVEVPHNDVVDAPENVEEVAPFIMEGTMLGADGEDDINGADE